MRREEIGGNRGDGGSFALIHREGYGSPARVDNEIARLLRMDGDSSAEVMVPQEVHPELEVLSRREIEEDLAVFIGNPADAQGLTLLIKDVCNNSLLGASRLGNGDLHLPLLDSERVGGCIGQGDRI